MGDRNVEIELKLLIEAIYLKYSYDFRDYSSASLKRRVQLALKQLDCDSISELQRKILYDPHAFMDLLQYLTIPVSEMFRDPSYYRSLREQVPVLRTYPSLKIWVAGCSTGEEVYSMAILLKEGCWSGRSSTPPTSTRARWSRHVRASSPSTTCASTPPTTSRPAAPAVFPTTTPPPTTRRSWTSH